MKEFNIENAVKRAKNLKDFLFKYGNFIFINGEFFRRVETIIRDSEVLTAKDLIALLLTDLNAEITIDEFQITCVHTIPITTEKDKEDLEKYKALYKNHKRIKKLVKNQSDVEQLKALIKKHNLDMELIARITGRKTEATVKNWLTRKNLPKGVLVSVKNYCEKPVTNNVVRSDNLTN